MNGNKSIKKVLNVLVPFCLGGGILYWMYRDTDFGLMGQTFLHGMNWWWMLFSLVFGVAAQLFRAFRWKQSLEPLGEHPRLMDCVHGVFISYASSLIVPRSGELTRCAVLAKYDGTSFPKALGTVVTERIIDSGLLLALCFCVMIGQLAVFNRFFDETGTDIVGTLKGFTATGYWVTLLCLVVTVVFLGYALRRFAFLARIRQTVSHIKEGIMSLRGVKNKPLLIFYSLMIWVCYFLHYRITFFCFDFTAGLSLTVALVSFIVGSISVIVPTPNGAGPWHFAVKTILILYGLADTNAVTFVLIVHTVQTALIPILGVYSLVSLQTLSPTLPNNGEGDHLDGSPYRRGDV
ncbi:MAG: flippase-like domain-containing protein [Bacteroidaceae bacterium]|nr:flippase-like domain-containing protein [Bacteroidaceae bacterium]